MQTDAKDDSLPLAGTVLVYEVNQYGTKVFKPANQLASAFANIAGTKTLAMNTIILIKAMGFTVHTTGESPRSL